jgi:hypothetical protein
VSQVDQQPTDEELTLFVELERIVSLAEAARLRGVSIRTLQRNDSDKLIQLSPRRRGMRVRDALVLSCESRLNGPIAPAQLAIPGLRYPATADRRLRWRLEIRPGRIRYAVSRGQRSPS